MKKFIFGFIFAGTLIFVNRPVEAQVCYSYDGLGRLSGVIDAQGQAAIYQYDAVGNILSISRQTAATPVGIVLIDPLAGEPGTQVEILGRGFSSVLGQNQVTINGLSVNVILASACRLTIVVPGGATSGLVSVTSPSGSAVSATAFSTSTSSITLNIGLPVQTIGTSRQFSATVTGCNNLGLVWSVDGIVGGNPVIGTITTAGLYTAPISEPPLAQVIIRVDSVGCPGLLAEKTILVIGIPNVTVAGPPVSFVLPSIGTTGGLVANVTVANPPVAVTVPAGNAGDLPPNITIGNPPVSVEIGSSP